jgi:hypothetical protein
MDGQKQAERAIPQRSRSCQQGQEMERQRMDTENQDLNHELSQIERIYD